MSMPRRKTTTFHNLFMLNPAPTKRLLAMCNSCVPIVIFFEIQSMRVANYANCRSRMLCASLVSNKHKPPFWQSHPRSRPGRICLADSLQHWGSFDQWSSPGSMEPLPLPATLHFTLSSPNFTVVGEGSWAHGRFGSSNSLLDPRLPSSL